MPHIIVEHSKLDSKVDINSLNKALHACLSEQETVSLNAIKTRSIETNNVLIGDGSKNDFIHIQVLILTGRSEELKHSMANNLFECAKKQLNNDSINLSINIDELGVYKK